VDFLIEHKADVTLVDKDGNNCLMLAARAGSNQCLRHITRFIHTDEGKQRCPNFKLDAVNKVSAALGRARQESEHRAPLTCLARLATPRCCLPAMRTTGRGSHFWPDEAPTSRCDSHRQPSTLLEQALGSQKKSAQALLDDSPKMTKKLAAGVKRNWIRTQSHHVRRNSIGGGDGVGSSSEDTTSDESDANDATSVEWRGV
jgi:hypothetical protein